MDEKKVLEVLRAELKTWNNDQLQVAFDFCDRKCAETLNCWWLYLRETVLQEITDREEARRNAERGKQGTLQ